MGIVQQLAALTLGPAVRGVFESAGLDLGSTTGEAVFGVLAGHFKDQSRRLGEALKKANERAWQTLEIALAGDSWWDRVKGMLGRKEDHALAQQVRAFLDATPMPELSGKTRYRDACLQELRAARKAGLFSAHDPASAAQASDVFARFIEPHCLLAAEAQVIDAIAGELEKAEYKNLAHLLSLQARQGQSLLAVAARYFFRRAVEEDQRLFQGLAFTQLETLHAGQEKAFAALHVSLSEQSDRLGSLLLEVQVVVVQTHEAVLDVQDELRRQGEHNRDVYQAVLDVQRKLDLMQREVRPRDSVSIRNDAERRLVRDVIARYRALPEGERRQLPALLNAVGKLEVAAGDFNAAQRDFTAVAELVSDTQGKGEAHHNAYRAALERRDWDTALRELIEAIKLDGRRFAPFPVGKYQPRRILGAGGFGVAFLCRHKQLDADVVVKTLVDDELERDVDQVFTEAKTLWQLDHPAIIRLLDCGYTFPNTKQRPYFVMHFFEGMTLEEYVQKNGPLSGGDLTEVARLMAQGLHAAHAKGILHRDVKPANVLIHREPGEPGGASLRWQVKLIDFGLAMKQRTLLNANTASGGNTILSSSIAGTLEYAAPEQMGRLPGARIGPPADIYGFAKTCCYTLFQTPQPLPRHWRNIPTALAALLENCLEDQPSERPPNFKAVLDRLGTAGPAPAAVPAPLPVATPAEEFHLDLTIDPVPPVVSPPVVVEVVPLGPDGEAEVAARWQALKMQMQKQIRSSDWDGAWETVDDMLAIKPYDREVLEARDYLDERRSRPKAKARTLSTRQLDEEVLRILKECNCGAYLTPDIPAAKLQNAMQSCRVPPGEKVLALIDCTTFGSASDCVIFGGNALYYHNGLGGSKPNPALIPYSDFTGCNFAKYWLFCVSVKDDWYFNLAGSNVNRGKVVETLNAIKHAVLLLADAPAQEGTPSARRRPGSALPERVLEVLQRYAGQSGFYVSPNIPPKKLTNATAKAQVPGDETILGLLDCTTFGSANDSLLFGSHGFYYYNMGGSNPNPGAVPYDEFPECQFATYWLNCISLGRDRYCNKAGASVSRDTIIQMLNAIKQAVIELR